MKLDELAERAGVSPRTVRYYVQRGLLPAPAFRGKDTAYSPEHLERLQAIRRLQEAMMPLDAIQAVLAGKSLDEVRVAVEEAVNKPLKVPSAVMMDEATSGSWKRWVLAPGLELQLSEDADAATQLLAQTLRAHVARNGR